MANVEPYTITLQQPTTLEIDDKPYFLYDGDTLINQDTKERVRLPNYDAGELSRIGEEFGEMHIGSFTGPAEKEAINNIIQEQNFNQLRQVETQDKDKYGRKVMDLFNPSGQSLSDYLQQERIVNRSTFMTKKQESLRQLGEFSDSLREEGAKLTSADKARALVNAVVVPTPQEGKVFGTFDEVFRGSALETEMYQSEINRLNAKLKKTTDPKERQELLDEIVANQEYLTVSVNTQPRAMVSGFPVMGANTSNKPGYWGESVNAAEKSLYMLSNTMGGFSAWAGDALNEEALQSWGNDWALSTNKQIRDAGYTTDFWSIRGPWDALRFISSSIIQYTPQMGAIFASGYAGGKGGAALGTALAPFTGGVSIPAFAAGGAVAGATTTAFILAVSSVYQGQPEGEKDPLMAGVIAMPIALADRFGVSKLSNINMFTKAGKEEYIDIVTKPITEGGKGWTRDQAEGELKKGIANIIKESGDVIKDSTVRQLLARKTFKDLALQAGKAGAVEGFTEAVQQAIEEGGLAATTSIDMDYEQLLYNMTEAFAVGGVVGTAFNVPFALREYDKYNEFIYNEGPEDTSLRTKISLYEEAHRKRNNNTKLSKIQVAAQNSDKPGESLEAMSGKRNKTNAYKDFISAMGNPIRFVQAYRGYFSPKYDQASGKNNFNMQAIGDLIGHINIYDGVTVAQEHRSLDSVLNKIIPSRSSMTRDIGIREEDLYKYLRMDEVTLRNQGLPERTVAGILNAKQRFAKLGTAIQEEVESRIDKGIDLKLALDPDESMTDYLSRFNNGNYFFNPHNINYRKVDQRFKELLSQQTIPSPEEFGDAESLNLTSEEVDTIMNEIRARDLSIESRDKLNSLGVFNNPKFSKYLSESPYEDATTFVRSLSKDIVMKSRFGNNGEVFANLLNKAYKAGEISEQEMYDGAGVISDFIKMNRHTYKPIKNKVLRNIQDNILFFGTLTYMDFNFFANMAEMTNGLIGLTPKQMWTYVKTVGGTFVKQVGNDLRRATVVRTGLAKDRTKRELADTDIRFERGVIAGTIAPRGTISYLEGVDTSIPMYQNFLNHFWNWNQVENQTNAVRSGRSALAWENISKMIATVAAEDGTITNKSRKARDDLNYYGLNPDRLAYLYNKVGEGATEANIINKENLDNLTPEERTELHNYYRDGLIRFTDEFVVRPEPGSTPKIIEDPRFALFTQFKRFIAHFTANVIPRAWSGYLASGKPAMTRQVFTVIVAAYAMAMLSQMMKDMIVYGEKAPWLEDDEEDPDWLRTSYSRAASYTGWGGTPFMAVEFINEFKRNSGRKPPLENLFDAFIGESPMLNTFYSDATSRRTIGETIAKRTPFLGDVKQTRETIAELLDNIGK